MGKPPLKNSTFDNFIGIKSLTLTMHTIEASYLFDTLMPFKSDAVFLSSLSMWNSSSHNGLIHTYIRLRLFNAIIPHCILDSSSQSSTLSIESTQSWNQDNISIAWKIWSSILSNSLWNWTKMGAFLVNGLLIVELPNLWDL